MKFRNFLILNFILFISITSYAKEIFEIGEGQKVSILSDKAFRTSNGDIFEAIGNVVITHTNSSIYGEKAQVDFPKGETHVEGNVRYISPTMNMYGSKLTYNFNNQTVDLYNARIQTDSFAVVGKKISRISKDFVYAEDSEYSTCRDCPESWSIFGRKVEITVNEYVKLTHAFIKVNGVVVMYVPYIVFPIKKERETGLLFPNFGLNYSDGIFYQQPFYWAISETNDLTVTPSFFGKRGFGSEFQFRQAFGVRSYAELNGLQINDEIYLPFKKDRTRSNTKTYRDFLAYEHHFEKGKNFNHHLNFDYMKDLDVIRDFDFYTGSKVLSSDAGVSSFFEFRNQYMALSTKGEFKRNFFYSDPNQFDDSYVQVLPKIQFGTVPINLLSTDYFFLRKLNLVFNSDFTVFKENKITDNDQVRNANRLNLNPYLDWQLGRLGPVIFSHKMQLDEQRYWLKDLGNTTDEKQFKKKGIVYESEIKVEFEKIFGISYEEEVPVDSLNIKKPDFNLIGNISSVSNDEEGTAKIKVPVNSYRHFQQLKFKHYYLSGQQTSGNKLFRNQIEKDVGQFDYVDALREKEFQNNQISARDSLPLSNTVEFQWNHILIKKTPKSLNPIQDGEYLKDHFSYNKISYLDLSQGVDLNRKDSTFFERLTRLYFRAGLTLNDYSTDIQEYYFHQTSEHKLTLTFSKSMNHFNLGTTFNYNSFNSSTTPILKTLGIVTGVNLSDRYTLKMIQDYNLQKRVVSQSNYKMIYSPLNNCWKLEVNYLTNLIDKKIGFNILINYNDNSFTGISRN